MVAPLSAVPDLATRVFLLVIAVTLADLLVFTNFLDCSVVLTVFFAASTVPAADFLAGVACAGLGASAFFATFFTGFAGTAFFAADFPAARFFAAGALCAGFAAAFRDDGAFTGLLPRTGVVDFFKGAAANALRTPAFFAASGFFDADFADDLPTTAGLARADTLFALARLAG